MRVAVLIKANESSERGDMPSIELLEAMGNFNQELIDAGLMLAGEGLKPSAEGKRVSLDGDDRTVIDGPFAATNELVAGFLDMGGQGHGRGDGVGDALPQSDARPQRDRSPSALRGRGLR